MVSRGIMKIGFASLLAVITMGVFSCSNNDGPSSNSSPVDVPTTAATPSPTPAPLWSRIEQLWTTDADDMNCNTDEEAFFKVFPNGRMEYDGTTYSSPDDTDCPTIDVVKKNMTAAERNELSALADAAARADRSSANCSDGGNESPSFLKLFTSKAGQETLYNYGAERSCYRGSLEANERLDLKVTELRRKYFGREPN
jgi:hypothetical protein